MRPQIFVKSYEYYHSFFYSSVDENNVGSIGMTEWFLNRKDLAKIQCVSNTSFYSHPDFRNFARVIDIDSDMKMFMSSEMDTVETDQGRVVVASLCSHTQQYNPANNSWDNLTDKFLTYYLQDPSAVACSDNDDSSKYNQLVGDSVWDYNCCLRQFGRKWESCSKYMLRINSAPKMYQKYNDTNDLNCELVDDPEYCSKHSIWFGWSQVAGWEYAKGKWNKNPNLIAHVSLGKLFETCLSLNHTKHNETECGSSEIDLATAK